MRPVRSGNLRWVWFGALTAIAVFALSGGKQVLAGGMLLLAVFAFFNDPLSPTAPRQPKPSLVLALSWVCGLLGVIAVVASSLGSWL